MRRKAPTAGALPRPAAAAPPIRLEPSTSSRGLLGAQLTTCESKKERKPFISILIYFGCIQVSSQEPARVSFSHAVRSHACLINCLSSSFLTFPSLFFFMPIHLLPRPYVSNRIYSGKVTYSHSKSRSSFTINPLPPTYVI